MSRSIFENLPHRKPELWRNLPLSLAKQARLRFFSLPERLECRLIGGTRLQIDSRDPMGKAMYLYGCYEYAVTRLLRSILTPEMCFLDVGANIGYYSIIASPLCKQVYAFEPIPSLHDRLQSNIELNGLRNVTAIRSAVADVVGSAKIFVPASDNHGLASLVERQDSQSFDVPVITLNSFVQEQGVARVDLIKIDIEGAELRAFEGASKLLSRDNAPDVIFEAYPGSASAEWLSQNGYRIFEFKLQRDYEARNLFATRRPLLPNATKQLRPVSCR